MTKDLTTIIFYSGPPDDNNVAGKAILVGSTLQGSTSLVRSILGTEYSRRMTPQQWIEHYSDWSNGYISSRLAPSVLTTGTPEDSLMWYTRVGS